MYSLNSGSSPDTASRLLQPHPRVPASPGPPRAARACWPHSNRCRPNTAGGSPQLGATDPQDHRGRPPGLPPLRRDHEGHCRDRRRGGHLPDPVPPRVPRGWFQGAVPGPHPRALCPPPLLRSAAPPRGSGYTNRSPICLCACLCQHGRQVARRQATAPGRTPRRRRTGPLADGPGRLISAQTTSSHGSRPPPVRAIPLDFASRR